MSRATREWREVTKFKHELHFKKIDPKNVDRYLSYVDLLRQHSDSLAFKSVSIIRAGHADVGEVLGRLFYHLLVRGLEHEERITKRVTFPRGLQVWKDQENEGPDRLLLAEVADQLKNANQAQFGGQLVLDRMEPVDSKGTGPIQIADLLSSSLGRLLNVPGGDGPKDRVARHFLSVFNHPLVSKTRGDNCVHFQL